MKDYNTLVFAGCGMKGAAYVGALNELENRGILKNINTAVGTSAGSIIAMMHMLGFSPNEMAKILMDKEFVEFKDESIGVVRDTWRLIFGYGRYRPDKLQVWLKELCAIKLHANATFREVSGLYVIGDNLSRDKNIIFCAEDTPDVPVWLGVSISACIPFFFKSIKYNGDRVCDGGLTWNMPMDLLTEPHICLGLQTGEPTIPGGQYTNIRSIFSYAAAVFGRAMSSANKAHVKANMSEDIVTIDPCGVSTTEFEVTKVQKSDLIRSGQAAVAEFLKKYSA